MTDKTGKNPAKEMVIVSMTTWKARIFNVPVVLDTIFGQTVTPDKIVLNLAFDEALPEAVASYISQHSIEVYRTDDTKVYKKFLPTLLRYPDACVINIDDDILYPSTMIEDFLMQHSKYPNNPICGNHCVCKGIMCHCGEASLTKYEYFGKYLECIDSELMSRCKSSDIVYTYFATKNGHPYIPSVGYYGTEYTSPYNSQSSWTKKEIGKKGIEESYNYLVKKYGELANPVDYFFDDPQKAFILEELISGIKKESFQSGEAKVRQTHSYRIGYSILAPIRIVSTLFRKCFRK